MFRVAILDIDKAESIYRDTASCVILPGLDGELSILDFHQPIICCLQEGEIRIDQSRSVRIKKGIARSQRNELLVLVEKADG